MSDDRTWPSDDRPGDPAPHEHRPNWGSAYPQQPPPAGAAPGFPPPHGYHPYGLPPKHSSATTAMVLGIVGLAGAFLCLLPIVMTPFAWYLGAKAEREIDESRGMLSGRGEATAGKVLGIIGTVLLVLAIAVAVLLLVLTFTVDGFWDDEYSSYDAVGVLLATLRG